MQCKKCGSEWKTNARASLIIRCPFCGAELEEEKEDKLTFKDAKEALRYIVKTYGVDVIIDGIQLRALLDEFIPDLKQERKVFMDAYEQGMCNALYLAHDESEIDKCIAILQSIKVLTTDACMAEKWASYVVECFVYALDWSVPMFGITPNIHMHQMPENIREQNPNRRLIGSGDFLDSKDESNKVSSETEQESHSTIFGFFHGSEEETPSDEDKTETPAQPEEKVSDKPAEQAAAMNENKPEEKPEEKPQRPVFDFTDEAEDEKKAEDKPEEKPEEKPQRPIFDFTDEAEDEKQAEDKPEEKTSRMKRKTRSRRKINRKKNRSVRSLTSRMKRKTKSRRKKNRSVRFLTLRMKPKRKRKRKISRKKNRSVRSLTLRMKRKKRSRRKINRRRSRKKNRSVRFLILRMKRKKIKQKPKKNRMFQRINLLRTR